MSIEMDDAGIERIIDIIDDGDLTAEAQEKLRQEGLWPLYESLRQTAYDAFAFGHRNIASVIPWPDWTKPQGSIDEVERTVQGRNDL